MINNQRKTKIKKRYLTLTGLATITGFFNYTQNIKTSTDINHQAYYASEENQYQIQLKALKEYILQKNPQIQVGEMDRLVNTIYRESKNLKLPENATILGKKVNPFIFLVALIETESTFNKYAISYANARGYVQILPQTAMWLKEKENLPISLSELHSTEINVMLGVKYLNILSTQFNDLKLITLSYNAGDGNVKKGIYDIRYWIKVQKNYEDFKKFSEAYQKNIAKEE
jgi:hypothetical protein